MAANTATLEVRIIGDASSATKAMGDVGGSTSKFQSGLSKATKVAALGGAALVAFGKQAFDAASDAQQAAGAVDAVFGKSGKSIHAFAKSSAESTGLASSEYETMAAVFGAQLKNMGVSSKKLAPQTDDLISLGADLAAQFGGSTSDAVAALSSLLRGETDPIEKYGVSIKAADVQAKKAAMGLDGLTGKADKQATAQATLALLTEQTADAQGAFGREANTAAGQQARATAQFKNASAAIGTALLPVISKLASWLGKLGKYAQDNAGAIQILGGALAALAASVLAVNVATKVWKAMQLAAKAASMAWTAAQWLLNAAMTANPIGLIVVGVAALIAGIVLLVKNWDKVTAAFKWFWNWIKQNWPKLVAIIVGPFGVAVYAIIKHRDKIVKVLRKVLDVARAIFRKIADIARGAFRAIVSVVRRFYDAARNVFRRIADVAKVVWRGIRDVARNVFEAIRDAVRRTADVVKTVFRAIRDVAKAVWHAIRDVARSVFQGIRDAWRNTADAIKTVIRSVRDVVNTIWRGIRDVAKTVFTAIKTAWRTVTDALKAAIRTVKDTARTVFDAIKGFIQWPIDKLHDLVGYITQTVVGVWDKIRSAAETALSPIKTAIDAIRSAVDAVKSAISNIKFPSLPSWLPGDFMQKGKAAPPGPTVARVASSAPAVPMRHGVGVAATSTAGAGGITINVSGALDPDAVARQIERILISRSRRVGGVRTAARPLV